jgi:hypothetical protein
MKKLIVIFFALIVLLCGCGKKVGESFTKSDRFIIVSGESNSNAPYYETIIADKNTGVLYLVIYSGNHCGITPLIDENGVPLLWEDWGK